MPVAECRIIHSIVQKLRILSLNVGIYKRLARSYIHKIQPYVVACVVGDIRYGMNNKIFV